MKKIAILLLLLFTSACVHAQYGAMHIYKTDGTELSYDVDSVENLTFTNGAFPYYYVMSDFGVGIIPYPLPFLLSEISSIQFADTLGKQFYFFYYSGEYYGLFPINNVNGFDSITFPEFETDTNVIQFPATATEVSEVIGATWIGNRIYCSPPARFIELGSNLDTLIDSIYDYPTFTSYCLAPDSSGAHLLSAGTGLHEYGIQTGSLELIDTAFSIANAVYYRGGDDTIIFYTYGGTNITPGYYLFDRKADTNILLLSYLSDLGRNEMINGFDVSPDGKTLLLGSTSNFRPPLFIEYDLAHHTLDTIPVAFDTATVNPALWVRYSHDGTKILYSNYPFGVSDPNNPIDYPSEIGIIDRLTGSRRALQTNPTSQWLWVGLFPEWSPDDTKIVYSIGELTNEPPGYILSYQVCILKSLQ